MLWGETKQAIDIEGEEESGLWAEKEEKEFK